MFAFVREYLLQPKTGDFIFVVADQSMSMTVEFLSNSPGFDQFHNHQQLVCNNNTESPTHYNPSNTTLG